MQILTRKILSLATEVTKANERVSTQPVITEGSGKGAKNSVQKVNSVTTLPRKALRQMLYK